MQTRSVDFHIAALESMKKYPQVLYSRGNLQLLEKKKIAIVGSRKPNQYARYKSEELAKKLSQAGYVIVSGGAIGIDAIAHKAAGSHNTILVAPTGLDKRYPKINARLIESIENEGLVLSQFGEGTPSTKYNFVIRNELVVALGDALLVTYAEKNSGTMRSVEYALAMGKTIYVLAHRVGESEGTNMLLAEGKAKAIYDIEHFMQEFAIQDVKESQEDPFLAFCATNPSYELLCATFPERAFEAELLGEISVVNGRVLKN